MTKRRCVIPKCRDSEPDFRRRVPLGISPKFRLLWIIAAAFAITVAGCASYKAPPPSLPAVYVAPPPPPPAATGTPHVTQASYYGRSFDGHKTSSGETYDPHGLTAASKTLPLGSYARVTNVSNGKSVVVRVNDRGPFVRGRGIDLSQAAAKRVGLDHKGVAKVKVVKIGGSEDEEPAPVPHRHTRKHRYHHYHHHHYKHEDESADSSSSIE
jgi:rare lipoprotein A